MLINLLSLLVVFYADSAQANVDQASASAKPLPPQSEIVVTGEKVQARAILGSRLPRKVEPDPHGFVSQIASDTGVAGFVPQSGMDPFAGRTKKIIVKTCKSSDPRISMAALCDLALVQKRMLEGDYSSARAGIDRVVANSKSGPGDRFFAHRFSFQIATIENDSADRSAALNGMIASGLLSLEDRVLARKTLASLAMERGDDAAAISELERLVMEAPSEAKAQANLGVLYARAGLHPRARTRMQIAAQLMTAAGKDVPQGWIDYLEGQH